MLVYSQEVKEQKREREKRGIYSPLYFSLFFFFSVFLFRSSALDFSVLLSYSPPFIVNQSSEHFLKSCVGYQCFAQYVSEIAGLQNDLAIVILLLHFSLQKGPY